MQIYYFSCTGRSQTIAQELAVRYGGQAYPIEDGKNWVSSLGYLKAAVSAIVGTSVPITYQPVLENQPVAVVFPVWAGKLPPAVKSFADEVGRGRLIAIPTSKGSTLQDRQGFAKVIDLVGPEISSPEQL